MLTTLRKDWCKPGDYERLQSAVKETYEWLYKNKQTATKDEFKAKEKKLMKVGESVLDYYGPPQTETDAEMAEFWAGFRERVALMTSGAGATASTEPAGATASTEPVERD